MDESKIEKIMDDLRINPADFNENLGSLQLELSSLNELVLNYTSEVENSLGSLNFNCFFRPNLYLSNTSTYSRKLSINGAMR